VLTISPGASRPAESRARRPAPDDVVRTMVPCRFDGEESEEYTTTRLRRVRRPDVGPTNQRSNGSGAFRDENGRHQAELSRGRVAGDVLSSLSGFATPIVMWRSEPARDDSPRIEHEHADTTNVPGPQQPVQTLGEE